MSSGADSRVTVSFETNAREQARAAGQLYRSSWGWKFAMVVFVGVPLGMSVWSVGVLGNIAWPTIQLALIALAGAWFWSFGIPWIAVLSSRRGQPRANGPFEWVLEEKGCSVTGPVISAQFEWGAIVKAVETKEFLFLYLNAAFAHYIPLRALGESDRSQIKSLLGGAGVKSAQ